MILRLITYVVFFIVFRNKSVRCFLPLVSQNKVHNPLKVSTTTSSPIARLYLFGSNKEKIKEDENKIEGISKNRKRRFLSFLRSRNKDEDKEEENEVDKIGGSVNKDAYSNATYNPVLKYKAPVVPDDPIRRAETLKAQAKRMKLEAERMDAELTLKKIGRLERELAAVQLKGNSTDDIVKEIDLLQRKIRGEPPQMVPLPAAVTSADASPSYSPKVYSESDPQMDSFNSDYFDRALKSFCALPSSQKIVLARSVGLRSFREGGINATKVALRLEKQGRVDFSLLTNIPPPPDFTEQEIKQFNSTFDIGRWKDDMSEPLGYSKVTSRFEVEEENDALLRKLMNEEYYLKEISKKSTVTSDFTETMNVESTKNLPEMLNEVMEINNQSEPYKYIRSVFPKCIEKKRDQNPTLNQVEILMKDILPAANFIVKSDPIEVYGGYLIRGESRKENGNDLIDAIDAGLANSTILSGKLTVTYIRDISGMLEIEDVEFQNSIFTSLPTALLVLGPDVTRERRRILLTIVSAFGIATSWYLSVYPFLLNPALMKQAEEQIELANANSQYDLNWLTDSSLPLAITFLALQFVHETGHRLAARRYGLNVTVPTLVPSLASGITSAITNLKESPKNREQLFDFAISGPTLGIFASLIALYSGLFLTLVAGPVDIAGYPALPLNILRQSSLGGGLIESVLGSGVLNVQEAVEGANTNIPLHPIAIAGYISLIVNALSLLPIGVTDGGRICQAVFNRAGKQLIGQFFLLGLFLVGILGDDLFLSYALFCSFFQQGSEIPQRNEVDDISFNRVLLAIAMGIMCLLSIIPMQ